MHKYVKVYGIGRILKIVELYESRSKSIKTKNVVDLLKNETPIAWKKFEQGVRLYRGSFGAPVKYTDPTKSIRTAANTYNYTMALMDILPSWSNWPKRSRALIGSTDPEKALDYGHLYIIFPQGDPEICFHTDDDFWTGWRLLNLISPEINDIMDVNNMFRKLESIIHPGSKPATTSVDVLNLLTDIKTSTGVELSQILRIFKATTKFVQQPFETMDTVFDPTKNGITKTKLSAITTVPKFTEFWISGPCYAVSAKILEMSNENS